MGWRNFGHFGKFLGRILFICISSNFRLKGVKRFYDSIIRMCIIRNQLDVNTRSSWRVINLWRMMRKFFDEDEAWLGKIGNFSLRWDDEMKFCLCNLLVIHWERAYEKRPHPDTVISRRWKLIPTKPYLCDFSFSAGFLSPE